MAFLQALNAKRPFNFTIIQVLMYTFQNFADLRIYKKDEMRFLLEPNEAGFRVWLWDINSR